MSRRRKGDKVDGWLVLDKPLGLSSAAAVTAVRRLFNAAKAGHGGTLDPLATGVLPIALGEATKTVGFAMAGTKTYRFTVRWGERRTTDDAEGGVIATSDVRPTAADIEAELPRFIGEIEQVPPDFSAIKVEGRRAYARARQGEALALAPRVVRIDRLSLLAVPDSDHAELETVCGKGTYIRSLARDLASALGTVGSVAKLRRTAVGPFREADAISLENLTSLGHSPARFTYLRPVETALDDIPALAVTEADSLRLRQGQVVQIRRAAHEHSGAHELGSDQVVLATASGLPVALATIELEAAGLARLRPLRVLNL
ncbi:MAG: tRNA pseudouridine(55) synthase TruB [Alphaproteobacteria bacterium]|nr:tRNA pseudouridine(55) synthase TruB [Alphaproteobacteria bacterium]